MTSTIIYRKLAVPIHTCLVGLAQQTRIAAGSPDWKQLRTGRSISSSECAAVFYGVSKTTKHSELMAKFRGEKKTEKVDDFTQELMNAGRDMEPVLLKEFGELTGSLVIQPYMFESEKKLFGIIERSTPDGICYFDNQKVALVEIKWRAFTPDTCGWGPSLDELGETVWCQVQHQMAVSGIKSAFVYTGCESGKRQCWHVSFSDRFRYYLYMKALMACANNDEASLDSGPKSLEKIRECMYETATEIKLSSIPKD